MAAGQSTDIKQFLKSVRGIRSEIRKLTEKICELEAELSGAGGISYDHDKIQHSPGTGMEDMVIRKADYTALLNRHKAALYERLHKAETMIESLDDTTQRQALREYYLSESIPDWDDVANSLGYSTIRIYQVHGQALLELKKHYSKL